MCAVLPARRPRRAFSRLTIHFRPASGPAVSSPRSGVSIAAVPVMARSRWSCVVMLLPPVRCRCPFSSRAAFEQRSVMNERLALLLGVDAAVQLRQMDAVRRAVVLDDLRVVHRDVGCPLLEVVDWVSPLAHHLGDEPIGISHCSRWIVDERRLYLLPAVGEMRTAPTVSTRRCRACRGDVHGL